MIRLTTGIALFVLVACGGGGGGGSAGGSPLLLDLFPVTTASIGTDYSYAITKTVTTGGGAPTIENKTRIFEVGRVQSPPAPDLNLVGHDNDSGQGAGFVASNRGLELTAFMQTAWWATDGVCVTLATPGLLIAPDGFAPGQTHQCSNLGGFIDTASVTWVGASPVAGHPNAHRFDFQGSAPYTNNSAGHPRNGATSHTVTATLFASPGIGPVQGTFIQRFMNGPLVVQERKYEFTLNGVTPGP